MSTSTVEIVPLTPELVAQHYGGPPPITIHGVAGIVDGKVIGIGGLSRLDAGCQVFSELSPEAFDYPVAIWRAAKQVVRMARSRRYVFAMQDPDIPGADRFLERLGFCRVSDSLWRLL